MSNTPAYDLILYLVAHGFGTVGGNADWSLHDGGLPAEPLNTISLISTSGLPPDTDEQDIFQPGIQVITCGTVKNDAYEKQEQVRELLIRNFPIITPTSLFTQIDLATDFLDLGKDTYQRYVWSSTYRTRRVLLT